MPWQGELVVYWPGRKSRSNDWSPEARWESEPRMTSRDPQQTSLPKDSTTSRYHLPGNNLVHTLNIKG